MRRLLIGLCVGLFFTLWGATPLAARSWQASDPVLEAKLVEYDAIKSATRTVSESERPRFRPRLPAGSENILTVLDVSVCDEIGFYANDFTPELGGDALILAMLVESIDAEVSGYLFGKKKEYFDSLLELAEYRALMSILGEPAHLTAKTPGPGLDELEWIAKELVALPNVTLRREGYVLNATVSCGGSDFGAFELMSNSQISSLYLMTEWNALVCTAQGIDPFDRSKCRGWRQVATPSIERPGEYRYVASWKGRKPTRGSFDFVDRREKQYQVTIKPSGVSFAENPKDRDWWQIYKL